MPGHSSSRRRRTVPARARRQARSPAKSASNRVASVCHRLAQLYGPARRPRQFDPLSELVFTILSQNTADRNTERAYAELKRRFPTWQQVLDASSEEIAEAIRAAGLANQKAPRIKRVLEWTVRTFGRPDLRPLSRMPVDEARRTLQALDGIGPKTAACVLLFACGMPVLPVDTHVLRASRRLGLVPERCTAEKAHALLEQLVPPELVLPYHVYLIRLGRELCRPRKPHCDRCPLNDMCVFARGSAATDRGARSKRTR